MGVFSAILASVCCLGPVVLVLMGLGALGIGSFLGRYHWFFLAGAVLILGYAWRVYKKEKGRCDAAHCEMQSRKSALTTLLVATIAVAVFAGLNVYTYAVSKPAETKPETPAVEENKVVSIPVEGMVCFTCELTVESALKKIDGVISAKANVRQANVRVTYDPQKVAVQHLVEAVNQTGYLAHQP